jgi:hypothetical protein
MIGRIMLGAGILAVVLFLRIGSWPLVSISGIAVTGAYVTSRISLACARRGFSKRVADLREALLYSRTLEKRLRKDDSIDPVERDDVEILISQVLCGRLERIPSWAICDVQLIEDLRHLRQAYPDRCDPDAQPTWLCLIGTSALVGCAILFGVAVVMSIVVYSRSG